MKVLIIAGISGSGKSVLEKNLISQYPDIFYKMQQFSTRPMRQGESRGDPYIFIQNSTFENIKSNLIGKIESSYANHKYGTLIDVPDGKIGTIILSTEGIEDFINSIENIDVDVTYLVVGLDLDETNLSKEVLESRGRTIEFIQKERKVLDHAHTIFMCEPHNSIYASSEEIMSYLRTVAFI